jgi:hypothetical protein
MSKFYSAIQKLDNDISFWEQIVKQYPNEDRYRSALATLKKERAELANRIGRKS